MSTRVLRLHKENGHWMKHRVILYLGHTSANGRRQREVEIELKDEPGLLHAGVAHGTGEE